MKKKSKVIAIITTVLGLSVILFPIIGLILNLIGILSAGPFAFIWIGLWIIWGLYNIIIGGSIK